MSGAFEKAYAELGLAADSSDVEGPQSPSWPKLNEKALYGLPGRIVEAISPHTEADPVAVLVNLLAAFGNAAGREAHVRVGADAHRLNVNVALVGETSKGRKGSSWGFVKALLHAVEPFWTEERVLNGLSSGEGLIYAIRDRVTGEDKDGKPIVVDPGVSDKRMLVVEGEFAGTLKVMTREGNTLSTIVRQAWDGGKLASLTKNSPLKATEAHVSIIGHVTRAELLRTLSETDTAGGFTNRFLWLMVRRSQVLPFGGDWQSVNVTPLVKLLSAALEHAGEAGEIAWGRSARPRWEEVYGELSEGQPGLFGAATSRAEAQTIRLAALYAVMDGSATIASGHLEAALALWRYAEQSAAYIFGDSTGDAVADKITEALEKSPEGLTRNELRDLFGRNKSSDRIGQSLSLLERLGRVRRKNESTGGRPSERWYAE